MRTQILIVKHLTVSLFSIMIYIPYTLYLIVLIHIYLIKYPQKILV
jgi:hypothetical protein